MDFATSSDASVRDGARAVTLAVKAVQASESRDPNLLAACRCACRGWTIRRSRRDSGGSKKALASTQSKPELASRLEEEIALLPRACCASRMTETSSAPRTGPIAFIYDMANPVRTTRFHPRRASGKVVLPSMIAASNACWAVSLALGKLPGFGVGCGQNPENGRVLRRSCELAESARLGQLHSLGSVSAEWDRKTSPTIHARLLSAATLSGEIRSAFRHWRPASRRDGPSPGNALPRLA